jgi:hypothetical protein
MKPQNATTRDRRTFFQRMVQRRETGDRKRGNEQRQSLEGLRLATLMKEMQALQAIQGLQELAPKGNAQGGRYQPSTDPEERTRQRQWLEFKADWLQAVLEDTVSELEALDRFEMELNALSGTAGQASEKPAADSDGKD